MFSKGQFGQCHAIKYGFPYVHTDTPQSLRDGNERNIDLILTTRIDDSLTSF